MDAKYIKMCEKATEIHKRFLEEGDYYCWVELQHKIFIWRGDSSKITKDRIWLPRQDQLQKMLTGDGRNGTYVSATSPQGNVMYKYGFTEILLRRCLLNKFHQWCNDYDYSVKFRYLKPFHVFESMEQLWLAFVMHQKKKVWNGEDWVHG